MMGQITTMRHVYSRERREQHDPDGDRLTKSVAAPGNSCTHG
jgi:hypothetical protein